MGKSRPGRHPKWDTDGGWNPDRVRSEDHRTTWSKFEMALLQKLADRKGVTIVQVIREGVHLLLVNNGLRPEAVDRTGEVERFVKAEKKRIYEPLNFMQSEPGELAY